MKSCSLLASALWMIGTLGFVGCGQKTATSCVASQTTTTAGAEIGIRDTAYGGNTLAQSFKAEATTTVSTIRLALLKAGTVADNNSITVTIETDSSGKPSGTSLSSGAIQASDLTTSSATYTITLSPGLALVKDTTYWIRLDATYAANATNLVKWSASDSTDRYTNGGAYYETSTAGVWSQSLLGSFKDFVFNLGDC